MIDILKRLRVRAAKHNRSMDEEVHIFLRDAVNSHRIARDLAQFTRECFASLGGVELHFPPRVSMREPPKIFERRRCSLLTRM